MTAGIYYILNLKNDRIYIGQSKSIDDRFVSHKDALKGGIHNSPSLQRDWNTYGPDTFKFGVIFAPGRAIKSGLLRRLERTFILAYQAHVPEFGYNTKVARAEYSSKRNNTRSKERFFAEVQRLLDERGISMDYYREVVGLPPADDDLTIEVP